ncbi:farnesyl diphosphate synthase [Clostridium tepidiprofundi DSM 19306]|uniref:Farnesyl diphosphate synthase n=1 Tax=Clostridium tepidiprofundi DSM 19306 TaxID=1121338 RepID=A0A151B6Y2_9CLOT|nr:farnesyl diphosphate synthase [Clostridium tepidiprofundi]KYH35698.1 farnesyl diphosphate synthase [Clostridium tepidiprofundi DSM 19306]
MKYEFLKQEINDWLNGYFANKGTYEKIVFEAMSYSLNNTGKRIRPILMLLTYGMYKENYKDIMPFACALEMIHTYSLIHDDLPCMDNDDLRRGKPTNHKVYGEAVATLAGDALLNEAFNVMLKECLCGDISKIKATYIISKSASAYGMIGGQIVDILSEGKAISEDELRFMHKKKTGELIKAALLAGAVLAEASDYDIKLIEQFGENLGLAFQIKDDILDVIGNSDKLGKKTNSDLINKKVTFVSLYGLEKCKLMLDSINDECLEILKRLRKDTNELEKITVFLFNRDF